MKTLYGYQTEAIDRVRQSIAEKRKRIILQLPTGAGKTIIASEIIRRGYERGKRWIFTCPAIELIDQTVAKFAAHGIYDVGVIQADHPMTDYSKPIQVASVQTLARRSIPKVDGVIIDEAHRMYRSTIDWMGQDEWSHIPFIGLTATPWATGMGRIWDHLIIGSTTAQMIEQGYLSKFRVFAPSHPDLTGVKTVRGDYDETQLSKVMSNKSLVADVVTTWVEKAEHRPTLVFAVDRAHARALCDQFQASGVKCGYVDGTTPKLEREQVRKNFERGEFEVVCNVGVLTTGVDWDVRCIVLARPTRSEMLYVQMIGRGLRTANGKDDCLILDHSDTTLRLGFVTDIHHDRLSQGKIEHAKIKTLEPQKPRECFACHAVMPKAAMICPECKTAIKIGKGSRDHNVDTLPGELVELESRRSKKKESRFHTMADKARFYSELKAFQLERGYRDSWSSNKYRDKFGVWPNDPSVRYVLPAREIGMATRTWIKSQQIAWAKSKAKTERAG
jgi:superfamily II DNA or RNA helicase